MVSTTKIFENDKKWSQILAIISASSIAVMSGILYAWPSPFLSKVTQDPTYHITESQASWFTVLHPLGLFLTSPFFVPVANIIGRKRTILLASVPLTTSLIIKAFAKNLWLLYFSRVLAGFGDAIVFSSLPAYIGEISVPKVRGTWGNMLIICLFSGQFIVNVVGSYCTIQTTSFIFLLVPAIFWSTFIFMPDSPYFYVMVRRYDEAKQSLSFLRRKIDVEKEFDDIKFAVEQQMQESASWIDLLKVKANRKALIAGVFLRTSQALSGIYAFSSYTQLIFEKAGGVIKPQTSAMLHTGLTLFMYACSSYGSNLLGRRRAYMISVLLAALVLFAETTYFSLDMFTEIDLVSLKWFPLAGMLTFVVVSSLGVGIVPMLMTTELFATSVKALGVSAVTVAFALTTLLVNYSFYYLDRAVGGLYGPFFLFGCCNVLSFVVAYFVLPETKDKTLQEIQEMLSKM